MSPLFLSLKRPTGWTRSKPAKTGELDCNGDSPTQKSVREMTCTDIKGILGVDNQNTWGGKFYDNGQYIGHDEPDTTFESSKPGSGGNITFTETIGTDPSAAPTDETPGSDVSHWFELTPAPWMSMALCDPNSYPQAPVQAELRFQRADEHVQRRWVDVHGDAAVPTR